MNSGLVSGRTDELRVTPGAVTDGRVSRRRRPFLHHLGEMLLAMFLGMAVIGGVAAGVFALAGSGLSEASASARAVVMAFSMTVPMVAWMRHRGQDWSHSAEMASAMVVPTLAAIGVYRLDAISADSVLVVQHLVMFPAMVGVMLWRYDHYSRSP